MNIYEKLQDEACKDGIDVVDYPFESKNIKGLYCDGVVAIRENIDTTAEKACVLAEELGHHYTSAGNILDQNQTENIKQERKARMWAYNKQIGLSSILSAYKYGCRNLHEMAEHLDITETFLKDALDAYLLKYGKCTVIDNYMIFFEPLGVVDMNYSID